MNIAWRAAYRIGYRGLTSLVTWTDTHTLRLIHCTRTGGISTTSWPPINNAQCQRNAAHLTMRLMQPQFSSIRSYGDAGITNERKLSCTRWIRSGHVMMLAPVSEVVDFRSSRKKTAEGGLV